MSEKQKGISLRKKRGNKNKENAPTISAPRQISAPMPAGQGIGAATLSSSARPSQDSSRSRSRGPADDGRGPQQRQRADKTADLVKRRYSQKIMQLPSDFPGNGASMPDLPQIPSQFQDKSQFGDKSQPRDRRPDRSADGRGLKADMRALRDPNLQAEQYVASMLADASEEDVRRYQDELRKAKHRASVDLQTNVYQNRTQFIKISKEAEKLKGEMRTLRQLMSDLTTTLEQTASATANGDAVSARRANRSSIGDLNQIRAGQLQQLYRDVEGSQKYLPPIPGRYIVWKSRRWFELDSATLKARRRVRLLLLNDHLLIAAEKKARNDVASQRDRNRSAVEYVAQRCFPLQDVQVSRAPEERVIVRAGNESFTYDTKQEDTGDKITFLSTFRKAKDDLRKSQEAEVEEKDRAQDSYNHMLSRDPGLRSQTELLENLSEGVSHNNVSTFVDIDGQTRNIRWVETQLDELDIDVALQRFEEAVAKVEKLKILSQNMRANETAKTIVTFKVNERAAKLANVLVRQLSEGNTWNGPIGQHVTWVNRLGFEDRAREAYLEARSSLIKARSRYVCYHHHHHHYPSFSTYRRSLTSYFFRQCTFEGNLPDYIFQISYIYFLIIKNTVSTFQTCFPQPLMSACVKWAKEHVDHFNIILKRQLSSVEKEGEMWKQCLDLAQEHAGMLRDVGLGFSELVGSGVGEEGDARELLPQGPVGLGVS
ncbi:hypothetical protein BU25DRAFT_407689 [Macroventuria anomochaeta]|uniref:Uncharacterized protein n=1 Tax=Macroventuria anomochaeta TaxID=301207 RepID=A0ACB6SA44_9PLEO|nr:uncharacterized protein BU25DRAFT_407689 [Macroventuria anomochaeta]KAF2631145.1 hypothetical protein BU25DRAFT_407689 [Macroventuria anomochaeta]